jgi:GNAT superfamily N-acetyltransferase
MDGTPDLEVAVAVADAWQHRGIGRALLTAAIEWAAAHQVTRLRADVRWSNSAILGLLRSIERPVRIGAGVEGDLEAVIEVGQELPAAA